jgi:hypothetical protein
MDRWFGDFGFRLGLLFLCLADRPRVAGGPSARWSSSRCSSCSSRVLERLRFDLVGHLFLVGRCLRTVCLDVADRSRDTSCSRTV